MDFWRLLNILYRMLFRPLVRAGVETLGAVNPLGMSTIAGGHTIEGAIGRPLVTLGNTRRVHSSGTIQAVVNACNDNDVVYIDPGSYNEAVTIPAGLTGVVFVGLGGRGAVAVAPSAVNATAITNHGDDITLINIGGESNGTGFGILNTGRRFRAYACKGEGGAAGWKMTLGTVAQIAALTRGKGDDCWLVDCEYAWSDVGLLLECTDYGAVTQLHVKEGLNHNNTKGVTEGVGSGGSAAVMFRNLTLDDITFDRNEDGTEPTNYIDLNGDTGNMGIVAGCKFPSALAGGKNLVSTGLIWMGNFHTGGISTGQPS